MQKIYDVLIKKFSWFDGHEYREADNPLICIFYDDDRDKALKAMQDYVKKNGFSYVENGNRYGAATLILREREATGETISMTMYHELFDVISGKLKEAK